MPRISEDTIQNVAAANDVVDVIGGYLQLKRAGANFKGLCPFHNEKTPSFLVNPSRQTYKCFGCGAGGGVFRFVMDYEKVDYPTAVRKLAARANIPIAEESEGDEVRRGERDRLLTLHRDAAAWFHENLMRQKFAAHAREYLKGRGIGSEVAVRWKLGYAPESWDALSLALRERGYSDDEILKSGLVSENRESKIENRKFYDRFRNRVMFPIGNDYGEVIGFSGRTLGDDPAKYVNSPETPIFVKGRVLFGLEKSKRAILAASEAVVCEGQLDLISAFEAGVENVTAPQGTAFTAQQARLLRRFADSAVLCFDSDIAGRKAVERSLPALLGAGLAVRVARVPAGEDPDSLVRKKGADALREVIAAARDYFDDIVEEELVPGASPQQRAALGRKLAGFVKSIGEPALRETVGLRLRTRLEISEAAFTALLKAAPVPGGGDDSPEIAEQPELNLPERAKLLCRLAILSPEVRDWLRSRDERAATFGSEYTLLDKLAASDLSLENPAALAAFASTLSHAEERAILDLDMGKLPEDALARVEDSWNALLKPELRRQLQVLMHRIASSDEDSASLELLHKQILDLQGRLIHV